jgi:hypothetical protein
MLKGCFHSPQCGSASVHHARRGQDARVARELSRTAAEAPSARPPDRRESRFDFRGVPHCKADPTTIRQLVGRAPWELSAFEFDAVCEPWFERSVFDPGQHRMYGLSISQMRFGLRLRLVILGGPEDGYVADVDASDQASLEDARRAFVVDALSRGQRVPAHVLADYPDL